MLAAVLAFAAPAFLLTACNDDPLFEIPPDAPTGVAVAVQGTSATVTWTPGAGATSQEVRMSPLVVAPASAGTALLVEDDHVQTFADNTTSSALFENLTQGTSYNTTVTAINGSSRTTSEAQTVVILPPSNAPILTAFYEDELDPTCLIVEWTGVEGAENYAASLTSDGNDPIADVFPASESSADMCAEFYDIMDGVTYTAVVGAVFGTETELSNTMSYMTDFFPWDDYFETSLHVTGAGKPFYYDISPNLGFERYTGIPYTDLACQGCHAVDSGFPGPATGKTCDRCHDTTDPQLGDEVDDSLAGPCGVCHGRQNLEAANYDDVHVTAGMGCMACHSLEDVHGDGTVYRTMIEDGAIDAECEHCHDPAAHPATMHAQTMDVYCTACHAASLVTCNNCHFDSEVNDHVKIFKGPPAMDWLFLLNRTRHTLEYVTVGNYQSVIWQDTSTLVAFGPYTPHTIMPAADARSCNDCHNNAGDIEAIEEYNANGTIQIVSFDAELNLIHPMGVVPFPEDYLTSYLFDWVSLTQLDPPIWVAVPTGTDTIQILPEFVRPLDTGQMSDLGMVAPTN